MILFPRHDKNCLLFLFFYVPEENVFVSCVLYNCGDKWRFFYVCFTMILIVLLQKHKISLLLLDKVNK